MVDIVGKVTANNGDKISIDGIGYATSYHVKQFLRTYKVGDAVYASAVGGSISFLKKYDAWAAQYPDRAAKMPNPNAAPLPAIAVEHEGAKPAPGLPDYNSRFDVDLMKTAASCATGLVKSMIESMPNAWTDQEKVRAAVNFLMFSIYDDQKKILKGGDVK